MAKNDVVIEGPGTIILVASIESIEPCEDDECKCKKCKRNRKRLAK